MSDIIRLLPDSVANQIAAGEVIQRPASVIKELVENAVDAGATEIHVVVKDAGRSLIRVVDNGTGMSETDARLSLERHATSKIVSAEDLFRIRTKGFRGEALASMAAIAHVEIRTRRADFEIGVLIGVEGSIVVKQEPCPAPVGTSISVKNLFYNVPARRSFLKSDSVEMRHCIDDFERIALIHDQVGFQLTSNDKEVYKLPAGNLRNRVIGILGSNFNERITPVSVQTNLASVSGFIGKPEFAKRSRGEQYFFLNHRYFKSPFFHHAVQSAYQGLVPGDKFPFYMLHLDIDPALVDVNVHPSKTEVKFMEERGIYAIIHAAVRESIGRFNLSPSLDFEMEHLFRDAPVAKAGMVRPPEIKINPDFNPFRDSATSSSRASDRSAWREVLESMTEVQGRTQTLDGYGPVKPMFTSPDEDVHAKPVFAIEGRYIAMPIKAGLMLIDIRRAAERIFYDRAAVSDSEGAIASQPLLIPVTVEATLDEIKMLETHAIEMEQAGLRTTVLGPTQVSIDAVPAESDSDSPLALWESFIHQLKTESGMLKNPSRETVKKSLAAGSASVFKMPPGPIEMRDLIDRLFAASNPNHTPTGKLIFAIRGWSDVLKPLKNVF